MQPEREPPGSARLPRELLVTAVARCAAKQAVLRWFSKPPSTPAWVAKRNHWR